MSLLQNKKNIVINLFIRSLGFITRTLPEWQQNIPSDFVQKISEYNPFGLLDTASTLLFGLTLGTSSIWSLKTCRDDI